MSTLISTKMSSMEWVVAASQNLVDMDLSDASKCRDQVLAFNKHRQLSMKLIPGRPAESGALTFYCYCQSHDLCGFRYRHVFAPSTTCSRTVHHIVSSKGDHSAVMRQVRGAIMSDRELAQKITEHLPPMRAIAHSIGQGKTVEEMPDYRCLQRARRLNLRPMHKVCSVGGKCTLGGWLDHLEKIQGGKWKVAYDQSGLCVIVHPKFGEDIRLHCIVVSIDVCRAFSFFYVFVFLSFFAFLLFSAFRTSAGFECPVAAALFQSASHRSA